MEDLPRVKSQIISLRVDAATKTISGWTELTAEVKRSAKSLSLHASGLTIAAVSVADQPAPFTLQPSEPEDKLGSLITGEFTSYREVIEANGDAAREQYETTLQAGLKPDLHITLPDLETQAQAAADTSTQPASPPPATNGTSQVTTPTKPATGSGLPSRPIVKIRIEFSVSNPAAGVHFFGDYGVTDNEVRRASAWFPCVDIPSAVVQFQLQLTVPSSSMAVGPGRLTKQTWADAEQQWRTFYYDVPLTCAPCDLGFATGPFSVLPGSPGDVPTQGPPPVQGQLINSTAAGNGITGTLGTLSEGIGPGTPGGLVSSSYSNTAPIVTHFAPPLDSRMEGSSVGDMPHTSLFFALPFALYCEVLGSRFPLPAMQQAFLPAEAARIECATFQGLQLLSVDSIIQPKSIEQSQEARLAIAGALAKQWFGHFIRPATTDDAWLVEGLAGWLQDQFVQKYMGKTEVAYRKWDRRETVAAADNGDAPPLAFRLNSHAPPPINSPWGPLFGTEKLDASPFRSLKATAVVAMAERRAGEELFRKHVEALISAAFTNPQARFVDATSFLTELGRAGDFKKEVGAFIERWVYGRGAPNLILGYRFYRRGCYIEVGIQQSGSAPAKLAAEAAEAAAQREGIGTGVIKVAVKEGSGNTADQPVHLGGEAIVHAELKVNPETKKVALKRGRKKKDEEEQQAAAQKAAENAMHPVQWVRLDPGGEWLCTTRVLQVERTLRNQLFESKDIVAQVEAVRGLGELHVSEVSHEALDLLADVLKNEHRDQATHLHCRVRMEAARALAGLRCDGDFPLGLLVLMDFYKERYWDLKLLVKGENGEEDVLDETVKSTSFTDIGEYYVAQAVVEAIASVTRNPVWRGSAQAGMILFKAVLMIKECCENFHSGWGVYDDNGLLAALCRAWGDLRVPMADEHELDPVVVALAMQQLRRRLAADLVTRSPAYIVGRACIDAMVKVILSRRHSIDTKTVADVRSMLVQYCQGATVPMVFRITAHKAYARFLAGRHSWAAALDFALQCTLTATSPSSGRGNTTRESVLARSAWEEVAALAPAAAAVGQAVPRKPLLRAATLIRDCSDARLRHLAFVTLRRLQQQPPTMFIPQDHLVLPFPEEPAMAANAQGMMKGHISLAVAASLPAPMDMDFGAGPSNGGATGVFTAVPEDQIKEKIKLDIKGMKSTMSGLVSGHALPAVSTGAPAISSGPPPPAAAAEVVSAGDGDAALPVVQAAVEESGVGAATLPSVEPTEPSQQAQQHAPIISLKLASPKLPSPRPTSPQTDGAPQVAIKPQFKKIKLMGSLLKKEEPGTKQIEAEEGPSGAVPATAVPPSGVGVGVGEVPLSVKPPAAMPAAVADAGVAPPVAAPVAPEPSVAPPPPPPMEIIPPPPPPVAIAPPPVAAEPAPAVPAAAPSEQLPPSTSRPEEQRQQQQPVKKPLGLKIKLPKMFPPNA